MTQKQKLNFEKLSLLCVRIKNAFTIQEIQQIHATYKRGIRPKISIDVNSDVKVRFDRHFVPCHALTSSSVSHDDHDGGGKEDQKESKEDLVQVKIKKCEYSIRNAIADIVCLVPLSRLDPNDLKQNHSKVICKTERRNFGVLYANDSNTNAMRMRGKTPNAKVKGHVVTYLDPIFTTFASNVYEKMMSYCLKVDESMKWELLDFDSYRTKCIEYIQYAEKGSNLGWHCDMGSLVTMVIMLSNSDEYEGGNLQCKNVYKLTGKKYIEKEPIDVAMQCGDCVIFASDLCNHRVTDVVDGKRIVLCMELIFW